MNITREQILAAIGAALEPLPFVNAMWEGGSASFDRVDKWSDIDLQIDVKDGHADEVLAIVKNALETVAPIECRFEIPRPTWHGHAQAFHTLQGASPYLMIDLVVIENASADKFLQRAIHGEPVVHFDRAGVTEPPAFDTEASNARALARMELLRGSFDLFQPLTLKEIERGNMIEAVSYYMGHTLRPLVELLRIIHTPERFNFHTRHIYYDLPGELVDELEPLFLPRDADDLRRCHARAGEMFHTALARADSPI